MRRRDFIKAAVAARVRYSILPPSPFQDLTAHAQTEPARLRRVRPSDPAWPSRAEWDSLGRAIRGRLVRVTSPLEVCTESPKGNACADVFKELKNPYYIQDEAALAQTCGWLDAWTAQPSVYAVAAQATSDVVAAVNFARDNNLRLVIKGGGHSYIGGSNAPDSLMIWMHEMKDIVIHDGFVAHGCVERYPPEPAVSLGPGTIWIDAYNEVTTRHGRYVQGGGCATVGVPGLVLGGGFGSYSKNFGTAAASLIEAEVVTADGSVQIANRCTNRDLFWALKGGGGGTFGVVTRVTLRTHALPKTFGFVVITIRAASDEAFQRLVGRFVNFYAENLHNPHWGEIVNLKQGNILDVQMSFEGLDQRQAEELWQPFIKWTGHAGKDFTFEASPIIRAIPASSRWNAAFVRKQAPAAIFSDDRPGKAGNVYWSANRSEAGHFIYGYASVWLPSLLLQPEQRQRLAKTLIAASRQSSVELHFQKGLAGGSDEAIARTKGTCMNPAVIDAFVLAIVGSEGLPAFPGLKGHEPNVADARKNADAVTKAMHELEKLAPDGGSYVAESDYFLRNWQRAYWGPNYPRLLAIKKRYDPTGLFFVHHGVGSEGWSADGFTRTG